MSEYVLQCFPPPLVNTKAPFCVSIFDNRLSTTPQSFSLEDFRELAENIIREGHEIRAEKDGAAISFAKYPAGATRSNKNIERMYGACLDLDGVSEDQLKAALKGLEPFESLAYSTYSDKPGDRCVRVMVPFATPVSPADYAEYWRHLNDLTGGIVDPATKDAARISYLPSRPANSGDGFIEYHHGSIGGEETTPTTARRFGPQDLSPESRQKLGLSVHPVPPLRDARTLIQKRSKRMSDDLAKAMDSVLKGNDFADTGKRDTTLFRLLCSIFALCPELAVEEVAPLFEGSIRLMSNNSPSDHLTMDDVRSKAARAKAMYSATRLLERGDEAEIGSILIEDLRQDSIVAPVSVLGGIYGYDNVTGIWRLAALHELSQRVQAYAERCRVTAGKDEDSPRRLKVSKAVVDGSICLAMHRIARPDFFEDAPLGIAAENGFVTIENGKVVIKGHSPAHRVTVSLPFPIVLGASCPAWLHFLASLFRGDADAAEKISALQEFVGACLVGIATRYARALVLVGEGRNGKSTFIKVITALFSAGSRCTIPPQLWDDQYRRAKLVARRLNIVSELPKADILKSEPFKAIVAGDEIDARHPYGQPFSVVPTAGHIFAANNLPNIDDQSRAFWARLLVIRFNRVFQEWEQVKDLDQQLIHTELAGIACWAVEGAQRLLARCNGTYTMPASHSSALNDWKYNSDQVAQWLDERTKKPSDPNAWATARDAYSDYGTWARDNGHRQLAANTFGERLKRLDVGTKKPGSQRLYELTLPFKKTGFFKH